MQILHHQTIYCTLFVSIPARAIFCSSVLPDCKARYPVINVPTPAAAAEATALPTFTALPLTVFGGAAEPVFLGVEALSFVFVSDTGAAGIYSVKVISPDQPSGCSSSWVTETDVRRILS